jgi:penicillin V acylase-like amidase (Ntn superfamily)
MSIKSVFLSTAAACLLTSSVALACSRVTFTGDDHTVITGRTLDWAQPMETNLWVLPSGLHHDGAVPSNAVTWTSKYGSVVAGIYDQASIDGINEKGLVANTLYLSVMDPGQRDPQRPGLSIAAWAQYVLDSFATVNEAVETIAKADIQVMPITLPDGEKGVGHLAISDPSGDSAIFEYIGGKLVIHHSPTYKVMTNEPSFNEQLALTSYWSDVGGGAFLPGTGRPADRFVRASYYLSQAPQTKSPRDAAAVVFSIMRNVSVPLSHSVPGRPNASSTWWRSASDQTHRDYYFEDTRSPNIFWVSLDKLGLAKGSPVLKLDLQGSPILGGEVSAKFTPAKPFDFIPATGS